MSIRRRTAVNNQPCFVEAQQLESKQLLTGVVTLAIAGANISVVGDSAANELDIQIGAANITVAGQNGTVLKDTNGVVIPNGTAFPKPANGNLSVNLKGGDDVVTVNASGAFTANNVKVDTGSGNDKVFVLRSAGGSYDIKGSVSLNTGSGNDDVAIKDVAKQAGAQTAAALVAIANDSNVAGSQAINVANDLRISTGTGDDSVGLLGVEVKRDLRIHSGFGHGDNVGMSNVRVGRNMDLIWGDSNALTDVTVVGKLEADSGTGDDTFALSDVSAGQLDINTGSGRDHVALMGVTSTARGKVRGGSGKDQIVGTVGGAGAKITLFNGNAVNPAIVDNVVAELVASGIL